MANLPESSHHLHQLTKARGIRAPFFVVFIHKTINQEQRFGRRTREARTQAKKAAPRPVGDSITHA
tara:strand:- start:809 stop:1006 length:198 start_codon:yes stop_codon:yes gene_type:complete